MNSIELKRLDGQIIRLERIGLKAKLQAPLVFPDSPAYERTRSIWNAMIDLKPGVIVQANSEQDVVAAVRFAAEHEILLAIRSGGHNIAGKSSCDGGIQIDLRRLNHVHINPEMRTANIGPGATLADIDSAGQAHKLVLPTGINSTTGIAGLTLGGGFGWVSGKFGLTIDNLLSARIVTASGEVVTASQDEHSDLFWALRGGGGNFGVVTDFEFGMHPFDPEICAGLIVYPLEQAHRVLKARERYMEDAPDDLSCWAVMRPAPPLPFIPDQWHGRPVVILAACFAGPVETGLAPIQALAELGAPAGQMIGSMPWTDWQAIFDPFAEAGMRNYWKSQDLMDLEETVIRLLVQAARTMPSPDCEIFIGRIDGAVSTIPVDQTPWPNREPHFVINAHSRWKDATDDSSGVAWARKLHRELEPFSMGSRYINFIPQDDDNDIEDAYGSNYQRLLKIKQKWDPQNLFRVNFNLRNKQ